MKYLITILMIGMVLPIFPQQIFKTKLQGMAVQRFGGSGLINGFSVSGPDAGGYVYLAAHSGINSGYILKTKWQGSAVQEFSLPEGSYVTGFEVSGPDGNGYVYLVAVGSSGERGEILKTKWQGTAVQAYSASSGEEIRAFNVLGPDASGYVYLIAATEIGIEEENPRGWIEPLSFAMGEITPNPCFGNTEISYSIAKLSKVSLRIYDCSGRLINKLVDEEKKPGRYDLAWPGTDSKGGRVSAGVYFVEMKADKFRAVRKIIMVR